MQISIARLMSSCAAVLLLSAVGLSWWMSSQVNRLDELVHELSTLGEAQENAQELRYHTAQIQQFYTDASLTGEREAGFRRFFDQSFHFFHFSPAILPLGFDIVNYIYYISQNKIKCNR